MKLVDITKPLVICGTVVSLIATMIVPQAVAQSAAWRQQQLMLQQQRQMQRQQQMQRQRMEQQRRMQRQRMEQQRRQREAARRRQQELARQRQRQIQQQRARAQQQRAAQLRRQQERARQAQSQRRRVTQEKMKRQQQQVMARQQRMAEERRRRLKLLRDRQQREKTQREKSQRTGNDASMAALLQRRGLRGAQGNNRISASNRTVKKLTTAQRNALRNKSRRETLGSDKVTAARKALTSRLRKIDQAAKQRLRKLPQAAKRQAAAAKRKVSQLSKRFRRCSGGVCECSFHGDTQVKTARGYVPIRDIRKGRDFVWARHELTGRFGWRKVTNHYSNEYDEQVHVTIEDAEDGTVQIIVSNRIHPFFSPKQVPDAGGFVLQEIQAPSFELASIFDPASGEWIRAENLKQGMRLSGDDGSISIISEVNFVHEPLEAFNITVQEYNTYFVKDTVSDTASVWVHNTCSDPKGPGAKGWKDWRKLQKYENAPYHTRTGSGRKGPQPTNPERAFDRSFLIKGSSERRIAFDKSTKEIVIFDKHQRNTWHGHTRNWKDLEQVQKNVLIRQNLFNRKGKPIE